MITAFRYRKQLLDVVEIDFVADPRTMADVLRYRDEVAQRFNLPSSQVSVCAHPLAEVHRERKAVTIRRATPPRVAPGTPSPEDIRAIKDDLGVTFAEMADRLGVKLRAVQRWVVPATDPAHRKPRGAALKLLLRLQSEAARKQKNPGQ